MTPELQRCYAEQAKAEAMIRKKRQVNQIVNGHVQPLHSLLTWMVDWASEAELLEAELIHREYAVIRAAGGAL